ncbi:MAG TPA: hypothetical protein VG898_01820 [Solirubrobacterales bacterium]|nr:hypothetical protein [Solirubrobacterales bacterium]
MSGGGRFRAGLLCLLAASTVLATAAAPAPADFSSAEIVHLLSLQREANGIPGALVERSDWSAGCAKHNYYEAQTGDFGHDEDPASPYYSEEGSSAAQSSVLAFGTSWSGGNPWENAPIHLLQMLAPQLSETGAAESYGHNCLTTWPGYRRPAPATLAAYSYPGDGVSGVVPAERAAESPFIPGDFVGLPQGTETGRYLLAYLSGATGLAEASKVSASATLVGPAGPVELRVIDSTSSDVGAYMPRPSAFLIPVQPLAPLTTYRASVSWQLMGTTLFDQGFSFTTGTSSSQNGTSTDRGRKACSRYSREARSLRQRAAKLRRRGTRRKKTAATRAQRRRATRMLMRAGRLKAKALQRARQAKRCSARASA